MHQPMAWYWLYYWKTVCIPEYAGKHILYALKPLQLEPGGKFD
jgi:hypothetical protein